MGQELPAAKNLPRIKLVTIFFLTPTAELFICFHFCFEDYIFAIVGTNYFVNRQRRCTCVFWVKVITTVAEVFLMTLGSVVYWDRKLGRGFSW